MCFMEVEKPSTLPIFSQKSRLPVLCTVPAVLVDVFVGTMLVLNHLYCNCTLHSEDLWKRKHRFKQNVSISGSQSRVIQ